jgi:hypothetical protein
MRPRAGLDAEVRRKFLCPCQESNPDRPARSQTLYYLSYRGSSKVCNLNAKIFRHGVSATKNNGIIIIYIRINLRQQQMCTSNK